MRLPPPAEPRLTRRTSPGRAGRKPLRPRWTLPWPVAAGLLLAPCLHACERSAPTPGEPIRVRAVLGEIGASPGQFSIPRAIDAQPISTISPRPWLWVVDKLGRVQRIDPQSGMCTAWWRMPEIVLGKPTGITIGPAAGPGVSDADLGRDALWVADTHYHQILVYDLSSIQQDPLNPHEPRILAHFGSYGEEPGQFVYPTDIALLTDDAGRVERIYVSEYGGNDRITCLDADFNVLFTFGHFGDSPSPDDIQLSRPQSIAIDPVLRELIVTDACNHRVGRFTLDGALVAWYGSPDTAGRELGHYRYPWGLTLLGDATALVVEQQGARVQHIDLTTGECLASYGRVGRGEGELATPWAITTLDGLAYVVDTGNNRVIAFDAPRRRTPPVAAADVRPTPVAAAGGGR